MIRMSRISKSFRLLHKNSAIKIAMEKSIPYINLFHLPLEHGGNRENDFDCSCLNNRTKRFTIVYTILLIKPLCHQSRFKMRNWIVRVVFDTVDPLVTYHILPNWVRNWTPSRIINESLIFSYHSSAPKTCFLASIKQ